MPKKNKDILVWFGDTEKDFKLRDKIVNHCVKTGMKESAFMKVAAIEKIERDDMLRNGFIQNSPTFTVPQQQSQRVVEKTEENKIEITEEGIENFLSGF